MQYEVFKKNLLYIRLFNSERGYKTFSYREIATLHFLCQYCLSNGQHFRIGKKFLITSVAFNSRNDVCLYAMPYKSEVFMLFRRLYTRFSFFCHF